MSATANGIVPIETVRAEVRRVLERHGRGRWLAREHLELAANLSPYQLDRALRLMRATEEIERRDGGRAMFRLPPPEEVKR